MRTAGLALAALLVSAAACTNVVGTYGPATLTFEGSAIAMSAFMQPIYPDPDFSNFDVGWSIGFSQQPPGSPCATDTIADVGGAQIVRGGQANDSPGPMPAGTYALSSDHPAMGQINAMVYAPSGEPWATGTLTITTSTDRAISGSLSADQMVEGTPQHIEGTFTANRCFQ